MIKDIGKVNALYPTVTVIIGTEADGKPTFNAIAHAGVIDMFTISVSSGKKHYTNQWIKKNMVLSVNIPSEDMLKETDYVGTVSGWDTDKSGVFRTSPGTIAGAPHIDDAPVCMECRVIDIYDRPNHDIFICRVEKTFAKEEVLTDGKLDFSKVKPIFYDMPSFGYWGVGKRIGYAEKLREKIRAAMRSKK
ncbi:MAG: flavin reductase family protein [Firmicutes bacterium]|nr:flavin reductase family protein [Bacillota bacterium]